MRKKIFGLVVAFVVLSLGLTGVKWKRENPTPTIEDKALQQRFIGAKEVRLYHYGKLLYELSPTERMEIAPHLLLNRSKHNLPTLSPEHFTLSGENQISIRKRYL